QPDPVEAYEKHHLKAGALSARLRRHECVIPPRTKSLHFVDDLISGQPFGYNVTIVAQPKGAKMPTDARELLTIREAADALGKSVPTLRRWIQRKKLAHYRIGGEIRFDPADIAAL